MKIINIQDIIPDREIIKLQNEEMFGFVYEMWSVGLPVYADQVERLVENGYLVAMLHENYITISKQLNPSPNDLSNNKRILNNIFKVFS